MPCGSVDNGGVHFGLQDFSVALARCHPRYLLPLQYIRSKSVNLRIYKMVTINVGQAMVARLAKLSIRELAKMEAAIDRELVSRNFMPRLDDMVGSYTEELVCHELGLERLPPETKVIDAKDRNGKQYQIKGTRSRTPHSVKLGKLNLSGMIMVDFAVGVVFHDDLTVWRALVVPHDVLRLHYSTSNPQFALSDALMKKPGVENITECLRNSQFGNERPMEDN